jgi:hypothetical protein
VGAVTPASEREKDAPVTPLVSVLVVLERRIHLPNDSIRERESKSQYVHVLKAALDRRRALVQDSG